MGNFDGFHMGHQQVIKKLLTTVAADNITPPPAPWLITFAPHPRLFFDKQLDNFLLTTTEEKIKLAQHYGLHGVVVIDFDEALANLSAEDFVKKILIEQLSVSTLLVGKDFRFGKKRTGDVATLEQHGIKKVIPLDLIQQNNHVISSSIIREKIQLGDVATAKQLLGQYFSVTAKIIKGDQWGCTIGFPTANLDLAALQAQKKILPAMGIYALTAQVAGDEKTYLASGYHGIRAGLDKKMTERLEAHLFNFHDDCYGKNITLSFHQFIRGDKKINNLEELKNQIASDNAAIKKLPIVV